MRRIVESCRFGRCLILLFLFPFLITPAYAALGEFSPAEDFARDRMILLEYRQGLAAAVEFVRSRPDLFPPDKQSRPRLLGSQEQQTVRTLLSTVLDYVCGLDVLGETYRMSLSSESPKEKRAGFDLAYGAFLTEYRYALEIITLLENDPGFDTVLNEAAPELGLEEGTYARFKYRFLHVARATEFLALQAIDRGLGVSPDPALLEVIREDRARIWRFGKGRGVTLTFRNGMNIVQKAGFAAWFPVQKGVASWMGNVRVRRPGLYLISAEQVEEIRPRLRPGDILLQRREWYLSNLGLPGFWTHVALYVGTAEERQAYFSDDDVAAWVRRQGEDTGDLEALLAARHPQFYRSGLTRTEEGRLPRVIEAIGEGVTFTSLEQSAGGDSLAVLRPRLPREAIARAIVQAFRYGGRPYDFNFDFLTDSALVCSELVYKVYEPSPELAGLQFSLVDVMGRALLPPNDMARQFDVRFGTAEQQTDLVLFLDGLEWTGSAREAGLDDFRRSWRRPKWHIFTQERFPDGVEGGTRGK